MGVWGGYGGMDGEPGGCGGLWGGLGVDGGLRRGVVGSILGGGPQVLVEPGTPGGHRMLMEARDELLQVGGGQR